MSLKPKCFLLVTFVLLSFNNLFAESVMVWPTVEADPILSKHGKANFREFRDSLRQMDQDLKGRLKNMDAIIHAGMVTRLSAKHMFLFGPPGGAKSLFVNLLLSYEEEKPFKLQLHQMMTEQALIGGQKMSAAMEGVYEYNPEGSIVTHKTAIIDEVDKGNPSILAPLLGVLNEGKVQAGDIEYNAKTESVFTTGNDILPEVFRKMRESGQESTAAALLNRFQIKTYVPNWLKLEHRKKLMEGRFVRDLEKAYLVNMAGSYQTPAEHYKTKPIVVKWEDMRNVASAMFRIDEDAQNAFFELTNHLRKVTHEEMARSKMNHEEDPSAEPFPYFPTADITTRFAEDVIDVITKSAFIDFVLSPLADDDSYKVFLAQPVLLSADSLKRAVYMLTTVSGGSMEKNQKLSTEECRDGREHWAVASINKERESFWAIHDSVLAKLEKGKDITGTDEGTFEELLSDSVWASNH